MLLNIRLDHLSVCRSVGLSAKCMAKRLIGSVCRLGRWVELVERWVYYMGMVIVRGENGISDQLSRNVLDWSSPNCRVW